MQATCGSTRRLTSSRKTKVRRTIVTRRCTGTRSGSRPPSTFYWSWSSSASAYGAALSFAASPRFSLPMTKNSVLRIYMWPSKIFVRFLVSFSSSAGKKLLASSLLCCSTYLYFRSRGYYCVRQFVFMIVAEYNTACHEIKKKQESPANAKGTRDSSACMKAHCEQM